MMKLLLIIMSYFIMIKLIKNKLFYNLFLINLLFLTTFMFMISNNFLNFYWMKIFYMYGFDLISFSLTILTFWIMNLSMISNLNYLKYNFNKNYMYIMMILMLSLILTFFSMNLLIFYMFFEISLIPILLIIMGWGYQIDRIQASMYMIFYTLFGSLPLLLMIMYIYKTFPSITLNFLNMNYLNINNMNNIYIFLMMNSAFMIKMPMYLTHLWLPKAHVEAPISGSMILAGIMLKMGSYGIYRSILIFPKLMFKFNTMFIMISIMGSIYTSLICLNNNDLKIIIAYSSIVHMGLMFSSMLTMTNMSLKGSILMMIAHGLCSSSLFFIVNLNYKRILSRSMFMNKSMINFLPSLSLWMFLICISNFSAPPSTNLFSEILLINSLIQWNFYLMMFIMLLSFFSTSYSIMLFAYTQYGKLNFSKFNFNMINCQELLMIMMHWIPLNLMFLNFNIFM
uniref:NADH-ubiquinone oxidoreductase chain 4 n=1 Tax=Pambolus sp. QL-2013 TaxID=1421597 RepID=A0A0A6ZL33_9HYME|nr:NADH dehydrogenase subunit 4 [Pambolus sp. QL-2013]